MDRLDDETEDAYDNDWYPEDEWCDEHDEPTEDCYDLHEDD